jgi:hypothetical protein
VLANKSLGIEAIPVEIYTLLHVYHSISKRDYRVFLFLLFLAVPKRSPMIQVSNPTMRGKT